MKPSVQLWSHPDSKKIILQMVFFACCLQYYFVQAIIGQAPTSSAFAPKLWFSSMHSSTCCLSVCADGVHMSDNQKAAHEHEGPSRQQASAKRVRHMGTADPNHQTQGSAVSAAHSVHAEPSGSTTQSPQPAAAAARYFLAAYTSAIYLHCCCTKQCHGAG